MTGCDRCGAQALAAEAACPVCGLALGPAGVPLPGSTAQIPVRRHGTVPAPPRELTRRPSHAGVFSLLALGLGTALLAAGVGYWLW